MNWADPTIELVRFLLPGFLSMALFYFVTAHARPSSFERVVTALVLTFVIEVVTSVSVAAFLWLGQHVVTLGQWTELSSTATTGGVAILLGVLLGIGCNHDIPAKWLRGKITGMWTSQYPSPWWSIFAREGRRFVVLHLTDGRRLYGWPEEWPDNPDTGHFALDYPCWLLDDGTQVPLMRTRSYLIAVARVESVELLYTLEEQPQSDEELEANERLIQIQEESNADGTRQREGAGTKGVQRSGA